MKSDILSLKSIYQFLTVNDYPTYSDGIITKKNHTGLTLTKFWRENILPEFRNQKCGKQIWRNDGGRNRYTSDICNRSERLGLYGEYAEEISGAANPELVLRQTKQFMDMLLTREYNYEVFCQKLPCYLNHIAQWDENFSREARLYFENAWEKKREFESRGNIGCVFFCSWFLTLLMFHALAGNGEGESALSRLRKDSCLRIERLGKAYLTGDKSRKKSAEEVVFLTNKNTELCSTPLPRQHFFGREKEIFELRRMLIHGGKYLISGMGGIGKTELMRQLLKYCEEERLADYICVIQYEGSLSASFVKAFPQVRGTNMEDNFYETLAYIRMHEKDSVLIVIDNMDLNKKEELAILAALPATVFITSRCQELEGFTTYSVPLPDKDAAKLIFQDNYETALGTEDVRSLSDMLEKDIWRHTLTLRLLGRIATDRRWTLPQLRERMESKDEFSTMQKRDAYGDLQQMYRRIYADFRLKKEMRGLLQIFSVLPHQSYTLRFAERFLPGFLSSPSDMQESLKKLYETGWLEEHENGYSMHPFIAECVRSKGVKEREITPFLERLVSAWDESGKGFRVENISYMMMDWEDGWKGFDPELADTMALLPDLCARLDGKYSSLLSKLILLAYGIRYNNLGTSREELARLLLMKEKSSQPDSASKAVLYILLCNYNYDKLDVLKQEYHSLLDNCEVGKKEKILLINGLATAYYISGQLAETEEALTELKKYECEDSVPVMICHLQAVIAMQRGDHASYGKWLLKGYKAGKEEGRVMNETLLYLTSYYLSLQQFEQAERILDELESSVGESGGMIIRHICLFYRGSLAMYRGDDGYGIEQLEEARKRARNLWLNVADWQYAISVVELAMAYNKAGRREEAAECYREALDIYRKQIGHEYDRHRVLNNMSVMFLDWGKPKEALLYLEEALPIAQKLGGLGLAENENNLSRAWRQLNDREKELHYLRKAAPVLEQFYGSGHPKVLDAKRRLAE